MQRFHVLILCPAIMLSPIIFTVCLAQDGGPLRAGEARINITPDEPVALAGYGFRTGTSEGVHDSLYARVLAFACGAERLVLISTDLIGYYNGTAERFRRVLCNAAGLNPSQLLLAGIHTHSGPSLTLGGDDMPESNRRYTEKLLELLVRAVNSALGDMEPVRGGIGRGSSPVACNRRELRTDGIGWPREELIKLGRNIHGSVDREVQLLRLSRMNGDPLAALFAYGCHATSLGGENMQISGDLLGLAEQFVESTFGPELIAPAFAGASGDVDPWYRVLPGFNTGSGWTPVTMLLGQLLGVEVVHVYRAIDENEFSGPIVSQIFKLTVPGKEKGEFDPEAVAPQREIILTAARIGDAAFLGLGAEVASEIGLEIKNSSPFDCTFIFTHCNGAAGYLVPEHFYAEGGYEAMTSPFAPAAAGRVIKKALDMLYRLSAH